MDADVLWAIAKWVLIGLAVSPLVIGVGLAVVQGSILPHLIPRAEIERVADDTIARYPNDPEEAAYIEEHAAWHRSEGVEQGKWRRVRKAIRRRIT